MIHRSIYRFDFLFLHRKSCVSISVRCINIKLLERFSEALQENPIWLGNMAKELHVNCPAMFIKTCEMSRKCFKSM